MTKIEEVINELPKNIVCFLLEVGTKKAATTIEIGGLLKAIRPFSILISFDSYMGISAQFDENVEKMHDKCLDDNVMLFNMPQEQFLKKANSTKFHIIFAHRGVDAVPFKKFLVDNGKVVIV